MRIELERKSKCKPMRSWQLLHSPRIELRYFPCFKWPTAWAHSTVDRWLIVNKACFQPAKSDGNATLNMAVSMDLLEKTQGGSYVLTQFGHENLENQTVFVPEKATWTIWVTDEPLIPTSIIHLERHKEGWPDKNRSDTQQLPRSLRDLNDTMVELLHPHHTRDTRMRIKRIEEKGG